MKTFAVLAAPVLLLGLISAAAQLSASSDQQHRSAQAEARRLPMLQTPESIASEHRELHETLARAAKESNEVGSAARELERVLTPHFKREEEIATPPLGLLPTLAKGSATSDMRAVLPMTQALERELPQMLSEHEAIKAAVGRLRLAALRTRQPEYVRFADNLAGHARQEEEILYPAAVLVGRYVSRSTQGR